MPTFSVPSIITDPETGCRAQSGDTAGLQACRQAYFLKQQNQILQSANGKPNTSGTDQMQKLNERLESQQKEIESLKTYQTNTVNTSEKQGGVLGATIKNTDFVSVILIAIIFGFMVGYFSKRINNRIKKTYELKK